MASTQGSTTPTGKDRRRSNLVRTSLTARDKDDVVQQAKLMDEAGTAWNAVKVGNFELITKLFPGSNVYAKGPVGENVFHIAMLLNTPSSLAIAKYLVKHYGKTLVNTPFQVRLHESDAPGTYEGQTALHIAIINRDFDMVKFLVANGADVRRRAYGRFFEPGGIVYYGELPLSFAACTGQKEIVSYLKRHGALVNADRDTWGNSALHMTVICDQVEMYDHLTEFCGASEHVRNHAGQTPFLLAAAMGKDTMFQHIYNRRRRAAWAYGPLTSYSLPLREIDTVQSIHEYIPSALETVVRKGHAEVIQDPVMQLLLHHKWNRFAAAQFLVQAVLYVVFVISQTFLIWLYCSPADFNSASYCDLEYVGIVFAALFWGIEVVDIVAYTREVHRRRSVKKRTRTHQPKLFVIPGEVHSQEPRASFFGRLTMGMLPVAEGQMPDAHPRPSQPPTRGHPAAPGAPDLWDPDQDDVPTVSSATSSSQDCGPLLCLEGSHGMVQGLDSRLWQSRAAAEEEEEDVGVQGPGPVCEASDTEERVTPGRPPRMSPAAGSSSSSKSLGGIPEGGAPGRSAPGSPDSAGGGVAAGADPSAAGAGTAAAGTVGRSFQRSRSISTTGQPAFLTCTPSVEAPVEEPPPAPVPVPFPEVHSNPQINMAVNTDIVSVGVMSPRPAVTSGPFNRQPGAVRGSFNRVTSFNFLSHEGSVVAEPLAGAPLQTTFTVPLTSSTEYPPVMAPDQRRLNRLSFGDVGAAVSAAPPSVPVSVMAGYASHSGVPASIMHRAYASLTGNLPTIVSGRADADHVGETDMEIIPPVPPVTLATVPESFHNRQRGSGGDLPSIMSMKRTDVARGTHQVTATGDVSVPGGAAGRDGPVVDDLEPLDPGGVMGVLQSVVVAGREVMSRKLFDPTLLVMHFHAQITFVHFITWASTYGFEGGSGPDNVNVMQFNDLMMSLMGLTGWIGALYYFRGLKPTGRAVVMLELCAVDVFKFCVLYAVCNIGFTLAFYTLHKGTTYVTGSDPPDGTDVNQFDVRQPFSSIGYGMIQMVQFMYGVAEWDTFAGQVAFTSKEAFATIFFLLYVALVLLLLLNLLTAMVVHTYAMNQEKATHIWRARWAAFILRAENRMPEVLKHRFRMGAPAYDLNLNTRVYITTMEVMEGTDDKDSGDTQIRAQLESLLDKLRSRPTASGGGKTAF